MKKTIFLVTALLFSLLCIYSVVSYTTASVENKVALAITDPTNGLVSFVPYNDTLFIKQGESGYALQITNNLDTSFSYYLEYSHGFLTFRTSNKAFLYPGEKDYVTLDVANNCPTGSFSLPIVLHADFEGGTASILVDMVVCVEEGVLELDIVNDSITASWNSGTIPEGTEILWRHRSSLEEEWNGWAELGGEIGDLNDPGYYEFKAVFGEVKSDIVSRQIVPPSIEGAASFETESDIDEPETDSDNDIYLDEDNCNSDDDSEN